MKKEVLYLVIPCYNEEAVLDVTASKLKELISDMIKRNIIDKKSKILFVNDGSKDKTWSIIQKLHEKNKLFSGISLSRNKGHQNALLAGLMYAKENADMVISLDADLQDDINVIEEFVKKYYEGNDIVYGVRSSRKKDTFFKKITAEGFYKLMLFLGVDIIYNHADYRLMSKRALESLSEFKEVNLFLRGIVPLIGYKSCIVEYERQERFAGESKYPLKKMLSFAFDGITSFSVKPIRFVLAIGIFIMFISVVMLVYFLIVKLLGHAVSGWTFIVGSIWLLGGIQMLALGIIGEYIGKIYSEVKARPKYIISDVLDD